LQKYHTLRVESKLTAKFSERTLLFFDSAAQTMLLPEEPSSQPSRDKDAKVLFFVSKTARVSAAASPSTPNLVPRKPRCLNVLLEQRATANFETALTPRVFFLKLFEEEPSSSEVKLLFVYLKKQNKKNLLTYPG